MAKGFSSGKTKSLVFPGTWIPREGTFEATLTGCTIFWNDDYNNKEKKQLQIGLIMELNDPDCDNEPLKNTEFTFEHVENYIRLMVDDELNFSPGSTRAKAYKILHAFYGEAFDSFSDDFTWVMYAPEFDNMSSITEIPHKNDYNQGEEWLRLKEFSIMGTGMFGRKALIQVGYAEKPSGGFSERLTIVGALPLPSTGKKASGGKNQGKRTSRAKTEAKQEQKEPAEAKPATDNEHPKHVGYVLARLATLGIPEGQQLPFLRYFAQDPTLKTVDDFPRETALVFKGLYSSDPEQVKQQYLEWAKPSEDESDDMFPPDPEEDIFEDEDEFSE